MYFQLVEDPVSAPAPIRDDPRATLRCGLPDRYLTPDDIAEMFDVPLETVYQWRKKRTGPPGFRIGKHLRYDPADVRAYVTDRKDADRDAA
ncbi:helix-turn-helix domain-containing protein [Streptomyces sp. NPDC002764]|uniref:helix-turn-helix domain-containing protein n=1 Tax=Streptomyces sp. NPDC002764 TaxID=3154428 RepID=UPI003326E144